MVEFHRGEMIVFRNDTPWQAATNFLLASMNGNYQGQCWRYDLLDQRLGEQDGKVSYKDALRQLDDVSQDITQWAIVYHMTSGEVYVVMGQAYSGTLPTFQLNQIAKESSN